MKAISYQNLDPRKFRLGVVHRQWERVYCIKALACQYHADMQHINPNIEIPLMQVMKQLPHFNKLIQEAIDDNDESEDIAKGLARVFAEVGEAYVGLIAAGTHTLPDSKLSRPSWHCVVQSACLAGFLRLLPHGITIHSQYLR